MQVQQTGALKNKQFASFRTDAQLSALRRAHLVHGTIHQAVDLRLLT